MLSHVLLFVVGLIILYLGAEWLVEAASQTALQYGLRPLVVGLTIVSLGTSLPEFVVNTLAAVAGEDDIAIGNIVGSNISNVGLILGVSATVAPLAVRPKLMRLEYPLMMTAMLVFYGMAWTGTITQRDGLLLIIGLVVVMGFLLINAYRSSNPRPPSVTDPTSAPSPTAYLSTWWAKLLSIVGGAIGLGLGAHLMVDSAVHIAEALGIDRVIIGLTVVAIGTSLPELAASLLSAAKQEGGLAVGNVVGSNLLNVLFVVGAVALIRPLSVEATALRIHFPVMIVFCAVLLPIVWTGYRISRGEGVVLLLGFLGYMGYLLAPYVVG